MCAEVASEGFRSGSLVLWWLLVKSITPTQWVFYTTALKWVMFPNVNVCVHVRVLYIDIFFRLNSRTLLTYEVLLDLSKPSECIYTYLVHEKKKRWMKNLCLEQNWYIPNRYLYIWQKYFKLQFSHKRKNNK